MTRIFMQRQRMLAVAVPAIAILTTLGFALIKPHVTSAFTMIELPAGQFGPVLVNPGQIVNVCTVNWGDDTTQVVLGIVSAFNTGTVLARMEQTLPPGMGVCLPYLEHTGHNIAGIAIHGNSTGNFNG